MPITLNDFKKGGPLRNYVTQVGLLEKIAVEGVDQDNLLQAILGTLTRVGIAVDTNENRTVDPQDTIGPTYDGIDDEQTIIDAADALPLKGTKGLKIAVRGDAAVAVLDYKNWNVTYKELTINSAAVSTNSYFNAVETLEISNVTIPADTVEGDSPGFINFTGKDVTVRDVTVETGSNVYYVFEEAPLGGKAIKSFTAENITVDDIYLEQTVFNLYTLEDGAQITVKNSSFNLDVNHSNVMRLSNFTNAKNVTVTFENVNWNYEDTPTTTNAETGEPNELDFGWAGLIHYDAFGDDIATNGADLSTLATWKFNFKNCKYNGKKVKSLCMGKHNQVAYTAGIKRNLEIGSLAEIEGIQITFA